VRAGNDLARAVSNCGTEPQSAPPGPGRRDSMFPHPSSPHRAVSLTDCWHKCSQGLAGCPVSVGAASLLGRGIDNPASCVCLAV
jgi:hypothetical protein